MSSGGTHGLQRAQAAPAGWVLLCWVLYVYSKPARQLLLNLVCQLPCWLMVRGGPVAFITSASPRPPAINQ